MKISKTMGLLAMSAIAACAHTENSATFNAAKTNGFTFNALDTNNYEVFYKGEKNESKALVESYLIDNSARLTKALGYDYFFLNNTQTASRQFSDIGVVDGVGQLLAIFAVGLFNVNNYEPSNPYSAQLPYPKTHDTKAIEYETFVTSARINMGKGEQPSGSYSAESGHYKNY